MSGDGAPPLLHLLTQCHLAPHRVLWQAETDCCAAAEGSWWCKRQLSGWSWENKMSPWAKVINRNIKPWGNFVSPNNGKIERRDNTNQPAGLIRRRSRRQRLHGEELLAALHCVNTGAGQGKGSRWPGDAHSHGNDQGLGYVAQLLHRVGEQSLEDSPALSNWLRDEVAAPVEDTKHEYEEVHHAFIVK